MAARVPASCEASRDRESRLPPYCPHCSEYVSRATLYVFVCETFGVFVCETFGVFVCETFSVWSPYALSILGSIADRTTVRNGLPRKFARRQVFH